MESNDEGLPHEQAPPVRHRAAAVRQRARACGRAVHRQLPGQLHGPEWHRQDDAGAAGRRPLEVHAEHRQRRHQARPEHDFRGPRRAVAPALRHRLVAAADQEDRQEGDLRLGQGRGHVERRRQARARRGGEWRPPAGTDASLVMIKKTDKKGTYDWEKGLATWSGDVKPERAGPVKLQPGDVDALLLNLELARDVQAGEPLDYRMVDDGRVKSMTYKVVGKDQITIGGKAHTATKVSNRDGDKETIAWVVDGMPMPVRILQRKDGKDEIDLRIQSVQ